MAARFLLVEDDPSTQLLLRLWLEPLGDVVCCADGEEAWEKLFRGERVDLVVTDHEMPRMTGKELVRKMRADSRYRTTPVIMVTASIEPVEVSDLSLEGFLPKPVKPETLVAAAQKIINPD